nr:uncharacterized protein CTRU02_13940 [Colletotrichum truncatum]KAF6782783.1 hypothetical protein CTRU02_13940 [Colletotrichum truncatum]
MQRHSHRILAILTLAAVVVGQECYFPDGSRDLDGIPCPRVGDDNAVACCGSSSHYCLTNGLCLEPNAWTMYRNSCTDKEFRASGCPTICRDSTRGSHSGVNYCFDGAIWTCNGRNDCAKGNFTMPRPKGRLLLNTAVAVDLGIEPTSTGGGPSGTAIPVCSSAAESSDRIPAGAAAGIGVGIGVPLTIAVAVLTILLLREKKRTKAANLALDTSRSTPTVSVASPAYAKLGYSRRDGQQSTTPELPPEPTVRHELPQ